jgi:hypothetical protein
MKRINIVSLLFASILTVLSCDHIDPDDPGDLGRGWPPIEMRVYVVDESGRSLLDPKSEFFFAEGAMLKHRGSEYQLYIIPQVDIKSSVSRYIGFLLMNQDGQYFLHFGTIDVVTDYETDFIIYWKNNTRDSIHFSRRYNHTLHEVDDKWQLNGTETTHPIVIKKTMSH